MTIETVDAESAVISLMGDEEIVVRAIFAAEDSTWQLVDINVPLYREN